jgi:phosphate-selective porin OprO/OprP
VKRAFIGAVLGLCISSPLAAQGIGFTWGDHPTVRAGKWLRVDFRARLQGDVRSSEASTDEDSDRALDIARRRAGIEGRLGHLFDYQADYELSAREWRDVYLNYRQFKAFQLRIGKFKLPFGMDENTSATNLDFVYRSRINARLAPGRDRGVAAHGSVFKGVLTYDAGMFKHDGDNARPSNSTRVFGGRTIAVRLIVDPFRASKSALADFQAGAAISGTTVPQGFPAIRARTVLGASFFDSDVWVKGRRQRTALEARWRPGPFSLQAEYIRVTDERRGQAVDDGDLSPLVADGWYLSGTFALTGEEKSRGLERPTHRFGAVEVASRFETLRFGSVGARGTAGVGASSTPRGDLSTSFRADNVLGNSDHALTWGVNWYLNRWVKIQANLIRERLSDPSMGPLPGRTSFWSRVLRFQFTV